MRPFRALRPAAGAVRAVVAPPFDVPTIDEVRALAAKNPLSLMHVTRPEVDLPLGSQRAGEAAHAKARESFERIRRDAPLELDPAPSLYVYRLEDGAGARAGVVGLVGLEGLATGRIARHEAVRREIVEDRRRLLAAVGAQTVPVTLVHPDDARIEALVARAQAGEPLVSFETAPGTRHALFGVDDPDELASAFESVGSFLVGDGHELIEAAGDGPVLAWLVSAGRARVLPGPRLLKDLSGMSAEFLLEALGEAFDAKPAPRSDVTDTATAMYVAGKWYVLDLSRKVGGVMVISSRQAKPMPVMVTEQPLGHPLGRIEGYLLQERLFRPFFGINDPCSDARVEVVDGSRDLAELARRVDARQAVAAFRPGAARLADLIEASRSARLLPPRTSWFEPGLLSGLVMWEPRPPAGPARSP